MEYEIGEKFSYSAEGYNLLALLIELITNETYEDFIYRSFFKGLGYKHIGFWGREAKDDILLAEWHKLEELDSYNPLIIKNRISVSNYGFKGSTGIYSTSNTLFQWIKNLRGGKILSPKGQSDMFTPHTIIRGDNRNGIFYGYGWFLKYIDGELQEIRHSGAEDGGIGHNSIIRFSNKYLIIVLSDTIPLTV